jgi:uroporphyrinogen-III synthase
MLEGKTFWLTRPEGQFESLQASLQNRGAIGISLPMLAIEPLETDATIKDRVLNLDHFDLLFFVSTNAAKLGMALINDYWPQFPVQISLYAVGPTTAGVLEDFGLNAEYPRERMSSEAMLALESLQNIEGKKALIIRGVGGRELLAADLSKRDADVQYLEIYRRECPAYEPGEVKAVLSRQNPDGVIVTSAEALENLASLLERDSCALADIPLFVSSERIAALAAQSGFENTVTMTGADDDSIIQGLEQNF